MQARIEIDTPHEGVTADITEHPADRPCRAEALSALASGGKGRPGRRIIGLRRTAGVRVKRDLRRLAAALNGLPGDPMRFVKQLVESTEIPV